MHRWLPSGDARRTDEIRLWARFFGLTFAAVVPGLFILGAPVSDVTVMAVVAAIVVVLVVIGPRLTARCFPRMTAVWPAVVTLLGLGLVGWATSGIGPVLGGFYTMVYVHVGLTRRPGTTLKLVPLGATSWLVANTPVTSLVLARLPVVLVVWAVLGELLSRFTAERAADRSVLAQLASKDALTGMSNRHGLEDRLQRLCPGDAVVLLDIDFFKRVNDEHGHEHGDLVLADFGRIILAVLRPGDTAVRYGGEEILLLLPATDALGIDACLQRLRCGWAASHPEITFSAGAAVVTGLGSSSALSAADAALYRAKANGRARTEHAVVDVSSTDIPAPRAASVPIAC